MNKRTISSLILGATIALAASSATAGNAPYDMTFSWTPEIDVINALIDGNSGINVTSRTSISPHKGNSQVVLTAGGIALSTGWPGGHSIDYSYLGGNASLRNKMGHSTYHNSGKCFEVIKDTLSCGDNADMRALLQQEVQQEFPQAQLSFQSIWDTSMVVFSFTLDDKSLDTISTSFIFATDELFRPQGGPNKDIFAFWVDDVNYALLPNGKVVTVANAMEYYIAGGGEDYGYSDRTAAIDIVAKLDMTRDVHTIKIAIADAFDGYYDSGVFIGRISVVPEPETYAMMLAGLAMVGAVARRRKNA